MSACALNQGEEDGIPKRAEKVIGSIQQNFEEAFR